MITLAESRIPNPESRIPNPESRVPSPESRVPNQSNLHPGHFAGAGVHLQRQMDAETRFHARHGLRLDVAAAALDDFAAQRQPQARGPVLLADLHERIENPLQLVRGDAFAV